MRRISLNQPKEKVRGIKRRLKALDDWADSFDGYFPTEYANEKYWNWEIPVLDRLVGPPTTTEDIQRHCARAILRATEHISNAKPDAYKDAIVTSLITYPQMFNSKICVFFDPEHFESFYKRDSEWQSLDKINDKHLSKELGFKLPKFLNETGYLYSSKDEWEGEITTFEEEWWCFNEIGNG